MYHFHLKCHYLEYLLTYKSQGSFQNSIHTKLHTNVLCSLTNVTQFSFNVNAKCHNSVHFFSWANSYIIVILAFLISPLGSAYSLFLANFFGWASHYLFLQKVNSTLLLCQLGSEALLPLGQLQSAYRPTTHG